MTRKACGCVRQPTYNALSLRYSTTSRASRSKQDIEKFKKLHSTFSAKSCYNYNRGGKRAACKEAGRAPVFNNTVMLSRKTRAGQALAIGKAFAF
jgi:hypothetical protein